jgi:hypothetical protein
MGSIDFNLSSDSFFSLSSEINFNKPFQRVKNGVKFLIQTSLENLKLSAVASVAIFRFSINYLALILRIALSIPIGR